MTLKEKYQHLLTFVKWCADNSCSLIDGIYCSSCNAVSVLRDIGEIDSNTKTYAEENANKQQTYQYIFEDKK